MKDWQKQLIEKLVEEMRAGKDLLEPREYSEAIMWYSDKRLLEVAPDTKIYNLSHSDLFDISDNLYMRTLSGFDLLGKTSKLRYQLCTKV